MFLRTNKLLVVSGTPKSRGKQFFHKVGRLFSRVWIYIRYYDSLYMHVQLLQHNSFEHVEERLYDYIGICHIAGYRIQVELLQEQSTGDCLGYIMYYRRGILERRIMLKLITKSFEASHASVYYAPRQALARF